MPDTKATPPPPPGRSGRQHETFTIEDFAGALRGLPRDARVVVRLPDGSMAKIVGVTGNNLGPPGHVHTVGGYEVILESERGEARRGWVWHSDGWKIGGDLELAVDATKAAGQNPAAGFDRAYRS